MSFVLGNDMVSKVKREKRVGLLFLGVLLILILFKAVSAAPSFDVNTLLLKVTLPQGESVTKTISLSTTTGGEFSLESLGVQGIDFSEERFELNQGESKIIELFFNSSALKPGIYVGSVKISDAADTAYLPLILEVPSEDNIFGINLDIPPQYTDVAPGEKFIAQLKIFDLTTNGGTSKGLGSSSVKISYKVHASDGQILHEESEQLVVSGQVQVTKTILLPDDMTEGDYVFSAIVQYKSSVGTASRLFHVAPLVQQSPPNEFFKGKETFWIVGIFAFFFFGIIFLFVYFIHDRDKLLLDLKQYNAWEIEKQRELLREQVKLIQKKKNVPLHRVRKEIAAKVRKLQKRHKVRIKEFNALKEKGDLTTMRKKLAVWKKQGYNTLQLDAKMQNLSTKDMQKLLLKWKQKYRSS